MTGYVVDTDTMRSHANRLTTIKGDVDEAASAGRTTSLNSEAFGLLCSFLYPPAALVQTTNVLAIQALAGSISATATAITAFANSYDTVDDALSGELTKLIASVPVNG